MAKKSTFKPSAQQAVYFKWITDEKGSAILVAVAGSGKTTTLIEGLKLMTGYIFFGAYNKDIATEIGEKVAKLGLTTVKASTMHSAGLLVWKQFAKFAKVENGKCRQIAKKLFEEEDYCYMSAVLSLVTYAKQAAFGCKGGKEDSYENWYDLIDHFSVDCAGEEDHVIVLAKKVLAESNKTAHEIIDFDDMIYMPLVKDMTPRFRYDWVLIDEAQDTNAARRLLALKLMKPTARLVAVGDPCQAIYGFTGADADSIDQIKAATNAIEIPLTVSFRCPKAITAVARQYVSHIQSADDAPQGKVTNLKAYNDIMTAAKAGDTILCRFNAPIVTLAYAYIANGVSAKVAGREIGEGLKVLARRFKVKSASAFMDKMEAYREKEVAKLMLKEKSNLATALEDKCKCLTVIVGRIMTIDPKCKDIVEAISAQVDTLFGDNGNNANSILLSSIHKSKGREWERVFWLQTAPPKRAKQEWELKTETFLSYVAATRAKKELVIVPQPPKD